MKRLLAYVHAYHGHGRNAGAESTLHDMLKALVRTGEWECDVQINKQDNSIPKPYTIDGVSVLPFRDSSDPNRLFPEYDVVITHLECSIRSALVAKESGIPLIQLIHNTMRPTAGYLAVGCDLAVFNTDWVRDHHLKEAADGKTVYVPDLQGKRFKMQFRQDRKWDHMVLRPLVNPADYSVPTSRHFITLVNLFENKGPEVFFYLAREFPELDFLAVKGGYGKQEIPQKIPSNVTLWNNQKRATSIYQQTKIVLMPSDYESFGRIAVEAAASSIPSIVTPTRGLKEALDYAGNYCDRDDLAAWKSRLRTLTADSNAYEDASFAAKRRSTELWEQAQSELSEFINRCNTLAETRGRNARGS